MAGITTREKILTDVDIVRKHAIVTIEIGDFPPEVRCCPDNRLPIIAVIGRPVVAVKDLSPKRCRGVSQFLETDLHPAVLLEVGVGCSRPYHEAIGRNQTRPVSSISSRAKWFLLSMEQYKEVAPLVSENMDTYARERVSSWKNGPFSDDPFLIKTSRTWYSRGRKKTLYTPLVKKAWPRGIRFSVATRDELLLGDVLRADLSYMQQSLTGLAKFIDMRLNGFRLTRHSDEKLLGLKCVRDVIEAVERRRLLPHHIRFMADLRHSNGQKAIRHHRFRKIAMRWGIDNKIEPELLELAQGPCLGNQLKITTGLESLRPYVVFEVFPDLAEVPF